MWHVMTFYFVLHNELRPCTWALACANGTHSGEAVTPTPCRVSVVVGFASNSLTSGKTRQMVQTAEAMGFDTFCVFKKAPHYLCMVARGLAVYAAT